MSKSELLTELLNQKIHEIVGMNQSAESLLSSLLRDSLHLDNIEMTCFFDGRNLNFTHDFPEKQAQFDLSIDIKEAVEFITITLNNIYQNEQLQAQFN